MKMIKLYSIVTISLLVLYTFHIKTMEKLPKKQVQPIESATSIHWQYQTARRITIKNNDEFATTLCLLPNEGYTPFLGEFTCKTKHSRCGSKLIISLLTHLSKKRCSQLTMHKQTYRKLLDSCLPKTALLKLIKDLPQKENADETLTLLFPSDNDDNESDRDTDKIDIWQKLLGYYLSVRI